MQNDVYGTSLTIKNYNNILKQYNQNHKLNYTKKRKN